MTNTTTEPQAARRVWINAPGTLQPYHVYHGRNGIAIPDTNGQTRFYFTEGEVVSMRIDPLYLSDGWRD